VARIRDNESVGTDWAIRIDDLEAAVSARSRRRLDSLLGAARDHLGSADLVSFVQGRSLRHGHAAIVGIGLPHAIVRATGTEATLDDAIDACCDRAAPRLGILAQRAGSLSERPPVVEFLVRTWVIRPDVDGLAIAEIERTRDEQFLYHLSDEEALVRAELGGEVFFFYGARGRRVTNALVRIQGRWHRAEDVERPAWRLPVAESPVVVELFPADGSGDPIACPLSRGDFMRSPTLAAAIAEIERRSSPGLSVVIDDWGLSGLLWREAPGSFRAIGYQDDVFAIDPATGPFGIPAWARARGTAESKGARIRKVLACPDCGRALAGAGKGGPCPGCGRAFAEDAGAIGFLGERPVEIDHDPHASRNTPSKQLVHDIRLHPDGLVLNVGAGDVALVAENLVNLEVARYRATDVVADARRLPFLDASFDMVFSQSVLEHVPDPFACATEMQRVLKPGGSLYADVPFIAPFHGYPDHYFNATMNGLRRLFADLQEIDVREGPHHAPTVALLALLGSYCAMIRGPETRERILAMSVREFLDCLRTGRDPAVTRDLDPAKTYEISAGFAFYGRKPGERAQGPAPHAP
jgi:SAM-dependent methyltransferase